MSINRITSVLGKKRFKQGIDVNTNLQLELENKSKPLIEYNLIDIVNQFELTQAEREKSNLYRFSGKINIYTTNILSTTSTSYVNGKLTDKNWTPMFYDDRPLNWVMQLTYPSDSLYNYDIVARTGSTNSGAVITKAYKGLQYFKVGLNSGGGLVEPVNNQQYVTIKGVQKHTLTTDDYVYLYSPYNTLKGVFKIKELGINGENLDTDFTIDLLFNGRIYLNQYSLNPLFIGSGNYVKIINPSFDDVNFNDPQTFSYTVTSDINGGTTGSYNLDEDRYLTVRTDQPHQLKINSFVDIRVNNGNSLNGIWKVYNILGTSASTQFVIKVDPSMASSKGVQSTFSNTSYFRELDGTPCEYYVRQFELLTSNDYEVYPCAFSTNPYPDISDSKIGLANDTWLFQFNQDILVSDLEDNRKGSITEFYYTIIKRAGNLPFNWSNVVADWDFNRKTTNLLNSVETISIFETNNAGTVEKSIPRRKVMNITGGTEFLDGHKYIGDFVEFNPITLEEKTVSEIINRFGLVTQNSNNEGYYYKPFKKVEIRKYSTLINTAFENEDVENLPKNYLKYSDGTIAWRDLLPIGGFEEDNNGIEYPFLNNANYIYFNHNLYIRRQRPPAIINTEIFKFVENTNTEC